VNGLATIKYKELKDVFVAFASHEIAAIELKQNGEHKLAAYHKKEAAKYAAIALELNQLMYSDKLTSKAFKKALYKHCKTDILHELTKASWIATNKTPTEIKKLLATALKEWFEQ